MGNLCCGYANGCRFESLFGRLRAMQQISVIIFEVDIAAEQKQTYWSQFFVFIIFHCPNFFTAPIAAPLSRNPCKLAS